MVSDDSEGRDVWCFINDWPIRRFITLCFVLSLATLLFYTARIYWGDSGALISLSYALVPFMVMIPGGAILRIARMHGMGLTRSIFYSVALGLIFIMLLGVGLNLLHYANLIERPLTTEVASIAYPLSLSLLGLIAFIRDGDFVPAPSVHRVDLKTVFVIALASLLPTMVIIGTEVANLGGGYSIIKYVLLAICFTPLALLSHKIRNYETLIFGISFALILHRSLVTNYLLGYDVFSEYVAASVITSNGWWNVSESSSVLGGGANSSLSLVTLAPMLTSLTGIDTIHLFKAVYPFFFSFVPLALFKVVQSQYGERPALLAVMFFIGYSAFYSLMVQLLKQQMSEVFLLMLLLVLTEQGLSRSKKMVLVLTSLTMAMICHYAIGYLMMGVLTGYIFLRLLEAVLENRKLIRQNGKGSLTAFIKGTVRTWYGEQKRMDGINLAVLIYYLIFFFTWFSIAASGQKLSYAKNGTSQITGQWSDLSLSQFDALEFLLINYGTYLHNIEKYLVLTVQIIMVLGVIYAYLRLRDAKKPGNCEFLGLAMVGAIVLIACYVVPGLSKMFYFGRFFHFTFIFIAGFFSIGLYTIGKSINGFRKKSTHRKITGNDTQNMIVAVGVMILVPFLMFNTGAIYGIANDVDEHYYNSSYALDSSVSWAKYSDTDVVTAMWAANPEHRGAHPVTADWHRFTILAGLKAPVKNLAYQWGENQTDSIIFLSDWNVMYGYVYPLNGNGSARLSYAPFNEITSQVDEVDIVFSTGEGARVIYVPPMQTDMNEQSPEIYQYESTPILFALLAISALGILVLSIKMKRRD